MLGKAIEKVLSLSFPHAGEIETDQKEVRAVYGDSDTYGGSKVHHLELCMTERVIVFVRLMMIFRKFSILSVDCLPDGDGSSKPETSTFYKLVYIGLSSA